MPFPYSLNLGNAEQFADETQEVFENLGVPLSVEWRPDAEQPTFLLKVPNSWREMIAVAHDDYWGFVWPTSNAPAFEAGKEDWDTLRLRLPPDNDALFFSSILIGMTWYVQLVTGPRTDLITDGNEEQAEAVAFFSAIAALTLDESREARIIKYLEDQAFLARKEIGLPELRRDR